MISHRFVANEVPSIRAHLDRNLLVTALLILLLKGIGSANATVPDLASAVNLATDLRSTPAPVGSTDPVVYAEGYYHLGDGGGGEFYYDTAAATDDGGSVFCVAAHQCWHRAIPGDAVSPLWWGATCDGTGDDTAAIQAALAYTNQTALTYTDSKRRTVVLPAGTCRVSATLQVAVFGQRLVCAGPSLTTISWIPGSGPTDMILFQHPPNPDGTPVGSQGGGLETCKLDASHMTGVGNAISAQNYGRLIIRDNIIEQAQQVFAINQVSEVSWEDVYASNIRGLYGIDCEGPPSGADDEVSGVIRVINGSFGFSSSTNSTGVHFNGHCDSLIAFNLAIAGPKTGLLIENTVLANAIPQLIQTFDVRIDNPAGRGIDLEQTQDLWFSALHVSGSTGDSGFYISNIAVDVSVNGGDIVKNAKHGFEIQGTDVMLSDGMHIASNSVSSSGTYDGIYIGDDASKVLVAIVQSSSATQNYGIETTAGATNVTLVGNDLTSNANGGWADGTVSSGGIANFAAVANIGVGQPIGTVGTSRASILNNVRFTATSASPSIIPYNSASSNLNILLAPKGSGLVGLGPAPTLAGHPANFLANYYFPIENLCGGTPCYIPLSATAW